MKTQLTRSEISENQRWEERYSEPLKFDCKVTSEFVKIGDELFSVSELEAEAVKNPQPKSHPFKPHHYLVQKGLDEIRAYYEKHPERKQIK